jgi:hypothetical protein
MGVAGENRRETGDNHSSVTRKRRRGKGGWALETGDWRLEKARDCVAGANDLFRATAVPAVLEVEKRRRPRHG